MKSFLVLSVFVLLSGVRAGINQGNDTSQDIYKKCPLQLNTKLPGMNCSVPKTSDYICGRITCSALFSRVDIKLTMTITQVDEWPSGMHIYAYVSLSVPELTHDWSRSFKDGEKFKVPGFPLNLEGFEGADVFLQVSLNKENGTIYFKVDLHAFWSNSTTERTYNTTIFAGKTPDNPISTIVVCDFGPYPDPFDDDHGRPYHKSFKAYPTFAKVLTAMAVCVLVVFLIAIATFYYCKKKKGTAGQVKPSKPPSYEEATTTTKTKVPMQPLVNKV